MAKYQYTILAFNAKENSRTFGGFYPSRNQAKKNIETLKEQYPNFRFSVATVAVGS